MAGEIIFAETHRFDLGEVSKKARGRVVGWAMNAWVGKLLGSPVRKRW
jgi:hypothetical protein